MIRNLTRPLTRGLTRALSPQLLDPDAAAYIDLITAAGADLGLLNEEAITKKAISDSIIERKDLHIWELERRTYMPIWGIAAANAICMRSLTSGTFVGGVTHGAGFVKGDGSTAYFDMGVSPATLGLTTDSAYIAGIMKTQLALLRNVAGALNSSDQTFSLRRASGNTLFSAHTSTLDAGALQGASTNIGILSGSRLSGTRFVSQRLTSGRSILATLDDGVFGTVPTVNLFALTFNNNGTPGALSSNEVGAYTVGLGLSDADDAAYTLNLKKLWEDCSTLTLP
jgi:hypothetical protein